VVSQRGGEVIYGIGCNLIDLNEPDVGAPLLIAAQITGVCTHSVAGKTSLNADVIEVSTNC
jgi:hypothetical protein